MGITCGHCKNKHDTVAQVLECPERKNTARVPLDRIIVGQHDSPCVCGPYDRCKGIRRQDAIRENNWRAEFRAYND